MPEVFTPNGLWKRLLFGAILIVVASASTTALAAFREVDKLVAAFQQSPPLDVAGGLVDADPGAPQTILLVGSDRRPAGSDPAAKGERSDTLILVRLDPAQHGTALMSLPRDLRVTIPEHGVDKLNEAYSIGGSQLALETINELTGLRINHVVDVDFSGFKEAVDAVGCVYTDIDRRYFNDVSGPSGYATIDVHAGYQRLCNQDALDYVRYRHEDNDLVRAARQQAFLRSAKRQIGVGRLVEDRDQLIQIFGRFTRSTIRSRSEVLRLLKLLIASAGKPITDIQFEGNIGPRFVTASEETVQRLTERFLGIAEDTPAPREGSGGEGSSSKRPADSSKSKSSGSSPAELKLEDSSSLGRDQALQAKRGGTKFPVFYPGLRTESSVFVGEPSVYGIRTPDGSVRNAYRMVLKRNGIGEYYGLQGTNWMDPPELKDPSEVRSIDGRRYELFYDGDELRLIAWRTPRGVYWISNTLLESLSEKQMIAIARSAREL